MRQENVLAVNGTVVVTDSGPKTPIGDELHKAGDVVWVDGSCVYGHKRKSNLPVVISTSSIGAKRKYTVFAYKSGSFIHFVIYDLLTYVPIVDIESSFWTVGEFRFTCSDDCKKMALLSQTKVDSYSTSGNDEICEVQTFDYEEGSKTFNITKPKGAYNQIYRFQYDEDKLVIKKATYGYVGGDFCNFETYNDGELISTNSIIEKFTNYISGFYSVISFNVSVSGGQQSNAGARDEAYGLAMAAAAKHGEDYTASEPSYWVTDGQGGPPTFSRSESHGLSDTHIGFMNNSVINDDNLVIYGYAGKYMSVRNGDNFTKTEYGLTFSEVLTGSAYLWKYIDANFEMLRISSSVTCWSGNMREMLESWISYVKCISTGGYTGESYNIVNSTYSVVNITSTPAKTETKSYDITNVLTLHGGISLTGKCSLSSPYNEPKMYYATYLVGDKTFPYNPSAQYKGFGLTNIFPDAIKIAENQILTIHDKKYCICDLDTQSIIHTVPYDVLNSTANVFEWDSEELGNIINFMLQIVS